MVLNRQRDVAINLTDVRSFVRRLRSCLNLDGRDFNVCFVSDREIERLNGTYRGEPRATDVLAFPYDGREQAPALHEFSGFLGDIVISARTARRNARAEGNSTANEIRWLILHGLLHLLGYDHETDRGEMTALELSLRDHLGVAGEKAGRQEKIKGQKGRIKNQK